MWGLKKNQHSRNCSVVSEIEHLQMGGAEGGIFLLGQG